MDRGKDVDHTDLPIAMRFPVWQKSDFSSEDYGKIHTPKIEWEVLPDNINSASYKSVTEFVQWAVKNYPAERYFLIFWSHGFGVDDSKEEISVQEQINKLTSKRQNLVRSHWFFNPFHSLMLSFVDNNKLKGVVVDDEYKDIINNEELRKMLNEINLIINRPVDIIGFDACYMGMLEIAGQLQPYSNLMIASENMEPGNGWNYEYILNQVNSSLNISADLTEKEIGKIVVDGFREYYKNDSWWGKKFTLSVTDLRKLQILFDNLNQFVDCLSQEIVVKDNIRTAITELLKETIYFSDYYIDLGVFVKNVKQDLKEKNCLTNQLSQFAESVITSINDIVIYEVHNDDAMRDLQGLSIYFPRSPEWIKGYNNLVFLNQRWDEFLKTYFNLKPNF
jgi:hypothetical protein